MDVPEFSYRNLESCTYRQLQKIAKSMALPSNVKKVYLIEMVLAKQFSTPAELDVIIKRVKVDRLKASQSRRWKYKTKQAQASEITSTSKHSPSSPTITMTPKRPSFIIQYSPDTSQSFIKYQPKSYTAKHRGSDRILRSYNNKTPRPDYAMMDDISLDSYNTKPSSSKTSTTYNTRHDYAIINDSTSDNSYSTKIVKTNLNTKLLKPNYAIMGHNSVNSFNAKIVKPTNLNTKVFRPNNALMDKSCSILEPSNSILDQGSKVLDRSIIIKPKNLNTKIIRPSSTNLKPSYAIMDRNGSITKFVRGQNSVRFKAAVSRMALQRQTLLNSSVRVYNKETHLVPARKTTDISTLVPVKRKRTVSGIYPLETQGNNYYECIQTVDYRHTDGKITKINALIQKPIPTYPIITVQDVINRKIESQMFKTSNSTLTEPKAVAYKSIHATTATGSGISKENAQPKQCLDLSMNCIDNTQEFSITCMNNTQPIRDYTDASTNCPQSSQPMRQYLDFSINSTENTNHTLDFSRYNNKTQHATQNTNRNNTQSAKEYQEFSIDCRNNTRSGKECQDYSIYCTNNTQSDKQCQDFSIDCGNNIQSDKQYQDFSMDFTHNKQSDKQYPDFSIDCANNTQSDKQYQDFSIDCTKNTQTGKQYQDFSMDFTHNTQSDKQYQDFSTGCTNNSQYARQYNEFSTRCIEYTHLIRQNSDPSWTPTYTNVPIKETPDSGTFSVYYHKKIRSEQMRHRANEQNEALPHINEVFSQFNEVQYRNLTQPLYIQVSQESERLPYYPIILNNQDNSSMLESLYNFKKNFIVNEPLLKIATNTNTRCVFSSNTVVSAVAHPTPTYNNDSSFAQVDNYNSNLEAGTRLYDYIKVAERERLQRDICCNEVLSPTNSSIGTTNSQELDTTATIPEMVEDALELISQDGDYMERIDMDMKMQCVLCEWLGSQLVLEYHIRQIHHNEILFKESPEWSIVLTLRSLTSHELWFSRVVQYKEYLYIVSANYNGDCIKVALTTITESNQTKRGKITVYNKISGKPFVWEDDIIYIPETMPYQCTENCLKINTAELDLLPNSANLKLVNNELRTSDTKTIVRQTLDNIEIVVYIQIYD